MSSEPGPQRYPPIVSRLVTANAAFAMVAAVVAAYWLIGPGDNDRSALRATTTLQLTATTTTTTVATTTTAAPTTTIAPTTTTTTTTTPPYDGWVDPEDVGVSASKTVEGVLTFRGSPTRTYYGEGPVPQNPSIAWSFPETAMCSESSSGGVTRTWCGTGWTGQPSVWERDGRTWLAFGAYDRSVHVLDAETGDRLLADFRTGDLIKGSVSIDPDGFPLLYTGSRDNFFRIIALDRPEEQVELWRLSADEVSPTKWNNDWDGSALIIDDYLFEGGENSQFHIVKLNRAYDEDGLVTVDPELVFNAPGWDDELIRAVGGNVSIENSVAISGNTVYFANSGGLVQGWDITGLADGIDPERVFRFWAGDDIDATLVIDEEGFIYIGVEYERGLARAREVGQILKIDPKNPEDPIVWSIAERDRIGDGIWATPALYRDLLVVATNSGKVLGIDRATGEIRWTFRLPGPLWQSPVIVDDVLIQGDCSGRLRGFDLSDTSVQPPQLWSVNLGGCIESTPVVWRGAIYVGTRSGKFYAIK